MFQCTELPCTRCRVVRHLSTMMLSGKAMSRMQRQTVLCGRADAFGNTQSVIDGVHKVSRADDAWDSWWVGSHRGRHLVSPLLIRTSTGIQQEGRTWMLSVFPYHVIFLILYYLGCKYNSSSFKIPFLFIFYFIHDQLSIWTNTLIFYGTLSAPKMHILFLIFKICTKILKWLFLLKFGEADLITNYFLKMSM